MSSVSDAFEAFRKRLEITSSEQQDASRRQQEVRGHIRAAFDIERDFLTGSYARHTKTKPLKDIDIFFVLGAGDQGRSSSSPQKMLDAAEACLLEHYDREQVELGRRSIGITFDRSSPTQSEDGKIFSVDVVPAVPCGDHYEIPDAVVGEWIETNPEIHQAKATAKNAEMAKRWVPLVKMAKAWNRVAGKPIKPSFLIEVMALELVEPPFHSYPDELRRLFAALADRINDVWADPAGLGPAVSDQMTQAMREAARSALENAEKAAARAFRAEAQGNIGEAISIWRELLGSYFPAR